MLQVIVMTNNKPHKFSAQDPQNLHHHIVSTTHDNMFHRKIVNFYMLMNVLLFRSALEAPLYQSR